MSKPRKKDPVLTQRLRLRVGQRLRRRGACQQLSEFCGIPYSQTYKWFVKLDGRPTAPVALRALIWLEENCRGRQARFIPAWDELVEIMEPVVRAYGASRQIATHCKVAPSQILRHFSGAVQNRTEPEGETALAVLQWLHRVYPILPQSRRLRRAEATWNLMEALKAIAGKVEERQGKDREEARRWKRPEKIYRW